MRQTRILFICLILLPLSLLLAQKNTREIENPFVQKISSWMLSTLMTFTPELQYTSSSPLPVILMHHDSFLLFVTENLDSYISGFDNGEYISFSTPATLADVAFNAPGNLLTIAGQSITIRGIPVN